MTPQDFTKVAVLYGGWSAERDVSLDSGQAAQTALLARGVNAELIDATPDKVLRLREHGYSHVFIALHGRGGEDGQVQAALELQGLPYTGSGRLASGLCMDKGLTKQLWSAQGLPTPTYRVLTPGFDPAPVVADLGLPIFVKPGREGSSIGMSRVDDAQDLPAAYQRAAAYDSNVLAERFIAGGEYTAAILGDQTLPLIRIESQAHFYDYHAKYAATTTRYHCPCGLPEDREEHLRALARRAFAGVGAHGWGRVDFLLDEQGAPWLLEVNTVPGLTSHSLVPMAAAAVGIDFAELVWRILLTSVEGEA